MMITMRSTRLPVVAAVLLPATWALGGWPARPALTDSRRLPLLFHRCTAKIRPPGPGRTRHVAAGLFEYQFISAGCQIQAGAVDDTMNVHHPVSHPTCIPDQKGRGLRVRCPECGVKIAKATQFCA